MCKPGRVADPIESLSAVTLATSDMAVAVRFYEAVGFHRIAGGPTAAFTTFRVGASFLNLQLDPAHPPVAHVWGRAIFWVENVDECYTRARTAGYAPASPPADAPWGERYFHIRDPDGHELSFARPLDT